MAFWNVRLLDVHCMRKVVEALGFAKIMVVVSAAFVVLIIVEEKNIVDIVIHALLVFFQKKKYTRITKQRNLLLFHTLRMSFLTWPLQMIR